MCFWLQISHFMTSKKYCSLIFFASEGLDVVAPVTYHGMEVAPHLQQALQGLHHLLLAEALESGLMRELAALQLSNGGFQRHGSTLEDAHT